jgi:hypothetical protein
MNIKSMFFFKHKIMKGMFGWCPKPTTPILWSWQKKYCFDITNGTFA